MRRVRPWLRFLSALVPRGERPAWSEQWEAELRGGDGSLRHAWGALADAWYLRTEGWTMEGWVRDVRMAVRSLVRRPGFTLIAGLTLAVGIGANTAIFSIVDGVLINPLPVPDPDRVVSYNHEAPGLGVNVPVIPHSEAMYLHYAENARSIESLAVFSSSNVTLLTDGEPRQLSGMRVTQPYFEVMGREPFLGRGFAPGDDEPDAEPVVVLGYSLWEQSFGADRSILGELVELDGVRRRVVGVMPTDLYVLDEELWIPLTIDRVEPDVSSLAYIAIARLAEGATIESANAEMDDLLRSYAEANTEDLPAGMLEQSGMAADVKPVKELLVQDVRDALWVLLGTVGFVLLIACANVANLFLVRAEGRQRELAVRTAMGASRADIVRQNLSESIVLSLAGGLAGLALAALGVRGLLTLIPTDLPQAFDIGIDGSVLGFTLAISVGTGLLFGSFPAAGYGRRDVTGALRDGGRGSTDGRERHRVRSGLVIAQVALALVLLVGSGLMLRSFTALRSVDLGFESEGVLTFRYALPEAEYEQGPKLLDFHRRLGDAIAALPGVRAVGLNTGLPLTDSKAASPMEPVDQPVPEGQLGPLVERSQVTPDYFDAMSIDIVQGRGLEWADQGDAYRAVVVSAALAEAFWPGQEAVGKEIRSQGAEDAWHVVGVAEDVRFDGVEEDPLPLIYLPLNAGTAESPMVPLSVDVVVQVDGDPLSAVGGSREAMRGLDARLPMISPRTVDQVVDTSLAGTSFTVLLLGIAASIALLLGTVGIYGVVSYIVSRRTQEIGVRMALGAPAAAVLKQVVAQGMVLIGVGLGVGLVAAWGFSRALASLLYGVSTTDPVTFLGTAVLLAAVALLATWVPARRAARVDPVQALRAD